jgi:cytochrome c-type protein NapB
MKKIAMVFAALLVLTTFALASDDIATLRGGTINEEKVPPKIAEVENKDIKRARAYPMQPPTIPHTIRDYRVDTNSNKCLSCHSRKQTAASQAPMISVTHYMDREGNFLADVSPRRYFCEQCHVVQTNAPTLVGNDFKDIDQLLREAQQ